MILSMNHIREYSPYLMLFVFASAVAVFYSKIPGLLAFHEMYQFFLLTSTYFIEKISVAGGLSDYIAEFIVQFFYHPKLGALLLALLYTAQSASIYILIKSNTDEWYMRLLKMCLSLTPAILVIAFMSDENMMVSYPVALTLALCAVPLLKHYIRSVVSLVLIVAIASPLLYMMLGPVVIVSIVISIATNDKVEQKLLSVSGSLLYFALLIVVLSRTFFVQYPSESLFIGVGYYRQPTSFPSQLYFIPLYIIVVLLSDNLFRIVKKTIIPYLFVVIIVLGTIAITGISKAYESEKYAAMQYISMVRQAQWQEIIELSKREAPRSELSKQCVMLALAKCGQLGEQMFKYNLNRVEDIFDTFKMDCVSATPSAEVAYHLALINTCFRYYFDSQEAIPNGNKSAHMTMRMAECLMVNGKYDAARKYIERLKHTIYYSDWAEEASASLSDEKIDINPVWGEMRRLRFKTENFFFYPQLDTELGLLAIESEGRNTLAWDYFCATMLLKGDLQKFVGIYHYASEMFHQRYIPLHYQEAILLFWSFGHSNIEGLPYPVSQEVVARLTHFINKIKQNQNYWKNVPASYWTYYMSIQQRNQHQGNTETTPEQRGNEREG